MGEYDTRMELASRDIVARAIYEQMMKNKQPHVMLDISTSRLTWFWSTSPP